MDFVTGGAYNGKLDWVIENYDSDYTILKEDQQSGSVDTPLLIVDKLENRIYNYLSNQGEEGEKWQKYYDTLMKWEQTLTSRQLVIIGTDITGGIVPMDKQNRLWRDKTGFFYQQLTKDAQRVFRVWFGIPQQLK
ncbi:bifunctional adenosylcobinamide kinase/adenosylcobinamide-phosphate guanylyltransferase [Halobacillus shinanisalinarum]|uniref:Bifunctional adenosylcobinamide kinase/adenosylcobinamide-phosphate guanylyltransferase n=1 Tax=Halobacillus shinanisalinarum TaxID=2932258 RepID=A0ABY4H751_9BACI|nr:bifunctional adenosylcobinamide kinase/adenosylcobinamide-phosphate guanylyltransferase [Halobacillus shinanisalinarum]UOQ95402.1 bifunctional adenosylcobinamide kinase/adenosylcobinamide-phosphate guanylyltransferase [Halobacillus shinanisalinarum]